MSDQLLRDWVQTWARAGPELDAVRRREIAALTDEDIRQILQNLFSVPLPADSPARSSSGLVEQQRWFARLRESTDEGYVRCSTSLAKLWQSQGKRKQGYDLLAPIYEWFTEGFDTKDLTEAKALLEELAA